MLAASMLQGVPPPLQSMLSQMLSGTPSARPNAAAFSGCQWFQEDMLLRCLKFIDTILQRDTGQKVGGLPVTIGVLGVCGDVQLQPYGRLMGGPKKHVPWQQQQGSLCMG